MNTKIISLSFQRNATQSMHKFFLENNISSIHHFNSVEDHKKFIKKSLTEIQHMIEKYEKKYIHFSDAPYFMMYEYFDKKYPGSKFILVTRDPDRWLASFKALCSKGPLDYISHACYKFYIPTIEFIKSIDTINVSDKELISMYNNHNNAVKKYFKNKNNLLVLDIEDENKINKLSKFLGLSLHHTFDNVDYIKN